MVLFHLFSSELSLARGGKGKTKTPAAPGRGLLGVCSRPAPGPGSPLPGAARGCVGKSGGCEDSEEPSAASWSAGKRWRRAALRERTPEHGEPWNPKVGGKSDIRSVVVCVRMEVERLEGRGQGQGRRCGNKRLVSGTREIRPVPSFCGTELVAKLLQKRCKAAAATAEPGWEQQLVSSEPQTEPRAQTPPARGGSGAAWGECPPRKN